MSASSEAGSRGPYRHTPSPSTDVTPANAFMVAVTATTMLSVLAPERLRAQSVVPPSATGGAGAAPPSAGVAAPAAAATTPRPTFPKRRTGLWEVRSVGAQAAGLPAMQYCVGEHTDTAASHLDRTPGVRGACTLGPFQRAGEAWLSESVCRESRTTVTSRAIASGNFDTEYRIDTLVTYDPPLGGVRREDKDAVAARWIGACATAQRPGDMIIPGMGTLNMTDGGFRPEPEPRPPRRRAGGPASRPAP